MDAKSFQIIHEQYKTFKNETKPEVLGELTEEAWASGLTRCLLNALIENVTECLGKLENGDKLYTRVVAMLGALHYQHAKVLVKLKKMKEAEDVLQAAVELLKGLLLSPEVTFLGLRVLNHYCYLLIKSEELEKARELLELAELRYLELKDKSLYSNDDLFDGSSELTPNASVAEKLERLVTNNLQMLGFVHNRLGHLNKFAMYHHYVLRRQLDMREGDATVWAMKTARLGYFFLTRSQFAQARHHLAAACYVLTQYENTLKTLESSDTVLSKWEELNHRYADIAKCWVKYGLLLFNASKTKLVSSLYGDSTFLLDRLWSGPHQPDDLHNAAARTNLQSPEKPPSCLKEDLPTSSVMDQIFDVIFQNGNSSSVSLEGPSRTPSDTQTDEKKKSGLETEADLTFPNLCLDCFETCVTSTYVETLEDARALFLFTHSWLKKSKEFYTLKEHPMEYVNVVLDLSELYRYLAFYEDDIEDQYSVQKRRAEALETLSTLLREIRPPCYLQISIELHRELAEVQLEMLALNLRRLATPPPEAESALLRMEALADIHRRLDGLGGDLGHYGLTATVAEEPGPFVSYGGADVNNPF